MGGNFNPYGQTHVHRPRCWDWPSTGKGEAIDVQSGEEAGTKDALAWWASIAEYADHVVLECLDGLLGKVAAMIVGWDEFVCHLGEFNFGFVHE